MSIAPIYSPTREYAHVPYWYCCVFTKSRWFIFQDKLKELEDVKRERDDLNEQLKALKTQKDDLAQKGKKVESERNDFLMNNKLIQQQKENLEARNNALQRTNDTFKTKVRNVFNNSTV